MPEHDSSEAGRKRMNKKKLPKAVLRTADEMRDAADRAQGAPHPVDLNEAPAPRSVNLRSAADNVIEMVPKTESVSADTASAQAHDAAAAQRRRKAVAIVERYANWSAVG